ncbi:MAG: c-type cytochrome biogenesis protein CcsB [Deltaproteobacteria bacterium]|nr:c-type cytochrome biogenesis protein CcsB [Deltaproteobacteria bacterium]
MASSYILSAVTFAYLICATLYLFSLVFKKSFLALLATVITWITLGGHTLGIILRWVESYQLGFGHAPFSNLYESLVFFAWTITLVYLLVERKTGHRAMGVFVIPISFLTLAYASFSPDISSKIVPLIPALKSNWLIAHVITCFLGYAGFATSCGLSLMFLLRMNHAEIGPQDGFWGRLIPLSQTLEELIYQTILIGFLFLTIGIGTGAIWAHTAWGTYWSWDPKETWSLITWLIYAFILHGRMARGWSGKTMAILSLVGFMAVLFTYLGDKYLAPGLHSYGAK